MTREEAQQLNLAMASVSYSGKVSCNKQNKMAVSKVIRNLVLQAARDHETQVMHEVIGWFMATQVTQLSTQRRHLMVEV